MVVAFKANAFDITFPSTDNDETSSAFSIHKQTLVENCFVSIHHVVLYFRADVASCF